MGQRYRFTFTENGDVLDPSQWVEDNNELASEFNGYLDRDNFARNDILQAEITANAFTKIDSNGYTTAYTPSQQDIGWQGGNGVNSAGIYTRDITCPVDCGLVVEASLSWMWNSAGATSITGSGSTASPWISSTFASDTIQFRVLVDGLEVSRSGLFDAIHQYYGTFLVGAKVVTSGVHTVSVECSVNRRRWINLRQDGPCTFSVDIESRHVVVTQEKR